MKKQKDVMQTTEKLRREKWIKDKSQQIKARKRKENADFRLRESRTDIFHSVGVDCERIRTRHSEAHCETQSRN